MSEVKKGVRGYSSHWEALRSFASMGLGSGCRGHRRIRVGTKDFAVGRCVDSSVGKKNADVPRNAHIGRSGGLQVDLALHAHRAAHAVMRAKSSCLVLP